MRPKVSEVSPLREGIGRSAIKLKPNRRCTIVELLVFMTALSIAALQVTVQNFYIYRICLYQLGIDDSSEICNALEHNYRKEQKVEEEAATLASIRLLIEAGPPIIFGLFWSQVIDLLGSKVSLMVPLVGFALYPVSYLVMSQLPLVSPKWLLLASVPMGLMGGVVAYSVSGYKYIIAMTTPEQRAFRLSTMAVALELGIPFGIKFGGEVFAMGGFSAVLLSSFVLSTGSLLVVTFFLDNNAPTSTKQRHVCLNCTTALNTVSVLFKHGVYRMHILLLTGISCLQVLAVAGSGAISFFFTRLTFQWDQVYFSNFSFVNGILMAIGVGLVSYVAFKIYNMSPLEIGFVAALMCSASSLVWTFSKSAKVFYIGAALQFPLFLIPVTARATLSTIVPESDIGKVLACVGILEAIMPLVGVPLANTIYVATLTTFPSMVFIISAVLYLMISGGFGLLIVNWDQVMTRRQKPLTTTVVTLA